VVFNLTIKGYYYILYYYNLRFKNYVANYCAFVHFSASTFMVAYLHLFSVVELKMPFFVAIWNKFEFYLMQI
jgi:hypothetical protein